MHVGHHPPLVVAPAHRDVGHRQAPGIHLASIEAQLVAGLGQHLAMGDQEAHRLSPAPLQQLGWIKALQSSPDAVAALEVHRAIRLRAAAASGVELQGVGDEATASAGEFARCSGRHIWQGEEAGGGDVIHQIAAQAAGAIHQPAQPVALAGMQQDAQALQGRGAEHHQRCGQPLLQLAAPIHHHQGFDPIAAGV